MTWQLKIGECALILHDISDHWRCHPVRHSDNRRFFSLLPDDNSRQGDIVGAYVFLEAVSCGTQVPCGLLRLHCSENTTGAVKAEPAKREAAPRSLVRPTFRADVGRRVTGYARKRDREKREDARRHQRFSPRWRPGPEAATNVIDLVRRQPGNSLALAHKPTLTPPSASGMSFVSALFATREIESRARGTCVSRHVEWLRPPAA